MLALLRAPLRRAPAAVRGAVLLRAQSTSNAKPGAGGKGGPPPKGGPSGGKPGGKPSGAAAAGGGGGGAGGAGGGRPRPPAAPAAPAAPEEPTSPLLPVTAPPVAPASLVLQLAVKGHHPFYLNRFALALAVKLDELGWPRARQAFLPKRTERWTVLRGPHVDKRARETFERITHKRLFTLRVPDSAANIQLAFRALAQVPGAAPGVEVRTRYLASAAAVGVGVRAPR